MAQELRRIGRFAIFGAAGFGIGGVALGSLLSAGPKIGLESGLGVLIAGLGIPLLGFAIAGAFGGAALGMALRKGGIIRLAWFGVIAFLPGFLVLVIPLAIPWLFMGSINSEIYVTNIDGSNQANLTNSSNPDKYPAWSPDGTRIAFISQSKLYVMNSDGSNQVNLTDSGYINHLPVWSPDGTKIALIRAGNLYVMNANGSNQIELASKHTIAETDMYPAWSPDSTRIAFTSYGDYGDVVYVVKEVFGKYGFASAMIGATISIVLGAVLLKDRKRITFFSLAGALGFGVGMVIIKFSPLDPWHAQGYLLEGFNAVLGWGVLGIIGGIFLGAALGYLERGRQTSE